MRVGIIIPTFNHFAYAALAIQSACSTPGSVVIVVDDGSSEWPTTRVVRGWLGRDVPFVVYRYLESAGSLSRSWNTGLWICRSMGLRYAVCSNADVVFPRAWWAPIEDALERGASFAGPLTNAPGHARAQDIRRYWPQYELDDDPDEIERTQNRLARMSEAGTLDHLIQRRRLNGFTFAGKTDGFWQVARSERPFRETVPMEGNEDDFFSRAGSIGHSCQIVPTSFVFHYRSVCRGLRHPRWDTGAYRISTCSSCGRR